MKKKTILVVAIAVMLVAALVVGGTLAYFTDTKSADNTFTVGNVAIDLKEVFEPNQKLIPGQNIQKEVTVESTGSEAAYVRVHIAIPSDLNDGDPRQDASKNLLHFNFDSASVVAGQWSWKSAMSDGSGYDTKDWNFYQTKIDGKDYDVYVVTYRTALNKGETTQSAAMSKVYLDKSAQATANADGSVTYTDVNGNEATYSNENQPQIKVVAEAAQAQGFSDAYAALNTAFGTPGAAGYVSPFNK